MAAFTDPFARHSSLSEGGAVPAADMPRPTRMRALFPLATARDAFAQAKAPEKTDLKVGFIPVACATPVIMAHRMGLYAKHGLNVDVIKTAGWAVIRDKALSRTDEDDAGAGGQGQEKLFGLSPIEATLLTEIPYRGSLPPGPPTDPLIYRFYELVQVYGTTWKELIQEEFGDGIMSAIDFDMKMERLPDPKCDRVKITMSGKFPSYKTY